MYLKDLNAIIFHSRK